MNGVVQAAAMIFGILFAGALLIVGMVIIGAVVLGYTSYVMLLLAAFCVWGGANGISNLASWQSRILGKHLSSNADGILIGGQFIPYGEIKEIDCRPMITEKRLNFSNSGRDFTVLAEIVLNSGASYRLRAGQGPVTWFGATLGAAESRDLVLKLQAIERARVHALAGIEGEE